MAPKLNPCSTKKRFSSAPVVRVLSTLKKAIRIIKQKLNPSQQERFKASCFGNFFLLSSDIKFSGLLVHRLLSMQIHCHDEKDEMWFVIQGNIARFSQDEFALITGLNCGRFPSPDELVEKTRSTRLRDRYFGDRKKITTASLSKKFLCCVDEDDTFRLSLVYFLQAVLLSRGWITSIDQKWLSLVDDLNSFYEFPWGKLCYQRTLRSLKKTANGDIQKKTIQLKRFYTLCGFPQAFQFWAFEAIPLLASEFAKKKKTKKTETLFPRMLCWESIRSLSYKKLHKVFNAENLNVLETLKAIPFEAKQDYVKGITKFTHTPEKTDSDSSTDRVMRFYEIEKSPGSEETIASNDPQHYEDGVGDSYSITSFGTAMSYALEAKKTKKRKIKSLRELDHNHNVDGEKRKIEINWGRGKGKRKQRKRRVMIPFKQRSSKKQKIVTEELASLESTFLLKAKETGKLLEESNQKTSAYSQDLVPESECRRRDVASMSNLNTSRETKRETSSFVADHYDCFGIQEPNRDCYLDAILSCGRSLSDHPFSLQFLELVDTVLQRELDIE